MGAPWPTRGGPAPARAKRRIRWPVGCSRGRDSQRGSRRHRRPATASCRSSSPTTTSGSCACLRALTTRPGRRRSITSATAVVSTSMRTDASRSVTPGSRCPAESNSTTVHGSRRPRSSMIGESRSDDPAEEPDPSRGGEQRGACALIRLPRSAPHGQTVQSVGSSRFYPVGPPFGGDRKEPQRAARCQPPTRHFYLGLTQTPRPDAQTFPPPQGSLPRQPGVEMCHRQPAATLPSRRVGPPALSLPSPWRPRMQHERHRAESAHRQGERRVFRGQLEAKVTRP